MKNLSVRNQKFHSVNGLMENQNYNVDNALVWRSSSELRADESRERYDVELLDLGTSSRLGTGGDRQAVRRTGALSTRRQITAR